MICKFFVIFFFCKFHSSIFMRTVPRATAYNSNSCCCTPLQASKRKRSEAVAKKDVGKKVVGKKTVFIAVTVVDVVRTEPLFVVAPRVP